MSKNRLHLFQGYGIELEYMIVDRDTLCVKPITDELLKHELGNYASDFENGIVTWSNELVLHVVELKSTKPENDLNELAEAFAENVKKINSILTRWNAMLMPTGAHPFMDPFTESKLWPHDNNEIYSIYNAIFDCRGHGWSNVQSTHLNLPFFNDEEFGRLHAAIRLILPILPALSASTPILDGKITGALDTRLTYYKSNQARIPSITGKVIPEAVFTEKEYVATIYSKIKEDIAPFNTTEILEPVWVNSRGAIARFDRGSIEIRLLDCQECPTADIALLSLVIETLKAFVHEEFVDHTTQKQWEVDPLAIMLGNVITHAHHSVIDHADYLRTFGLTQKVTAGELWQHIYERISKNNNPTIDTLLKEGSLAQRIINALHGNHSKQNISNIYRQLCECLEQNKLFIP